MIDVLRRLVALTYLAGVLVVMVKVAAKPVDDPDAWWHLKLGDQLADSGLGWGGVEHWSRFATADWDPSAPLSDLIVARVYEWFGLPGIAWIYGVALIFVLVATYALCRVGADQVPAAVASAIAMVGMSGSLTERPQVISFGLLALVVLAWLRTEGDLRPRWWLVPMTWIWAMLHGYWFIGVTVGFAFALGIWTSQKLSLRRGLELVSVPALSALTAALTPVGPGLLLAPLRVGERGEFVEEGRRTAFDRGQPWVVLIMLILVLMVWLLHRRQATLSQVVLLLMAVGSLLMTERTVAVAALLAAPLLARALQQLIAASSREPGDHRREAGAVACMALLAAVVLVPLVADRSGTAGGVPVGMETELTSIGQGEVVFNDYALGGWLAWKFPQLEVVVDPLADAYSIDHLRRVSDALEGANGSVAFVRSTRARYAVLREESPLTEQLIDDGWHLAPGDGGFVLLTAPGKGVN